MKKLLGRILAFALMSKLIAVFCYGGWIRWVLTAILLPRETSGAEELGFALFRHTQFPDKTRVSSPVLTARSLATRSLR
jgi:hypothetical protein